MMFVFTRFISPKRSAPYLVLAMITGLWLAGCEPRNQNLTTGPRPELQSSDSSVVASTLPVLSTTLGGPLAGLTGDEMGRFTAGLAEFQEVETVAEGLGPVFNEASCVTCHNAPIGGTTGRAETRFGKWDRGKFDPLAGLGGSLLQDQGIGFVKAHGHAVKFAAEVVPRGANVSTLRITTPLFGLGLVDAIPDASLLALARSEARNSPSTAGTPSMTTEIRTGLTRVGRFGWKAQVPTVHQFAGDAYLNEMGITNPEFPIENAPQGNKDLLAFNPDPALNDNGDGVAAFADFMTLLGPPPRGGRNSQVDAGAQVFSSIGCVNCHTPTQETGDSPVMALAHKKFQPFSDFLLHDMGQLGDGIVQGQAGGRQFRTAPLWGLSARPAFLHDGRAKTPEAAIAAHSGQGRDASQNFARLDSRSRAALMAFLRSL
jgi:CxxC motif-containing protein (DUF1111 family)